jgi:hypothetical protein
LLQAKSIKKPYSLAVLFHIIIAQLFAGKENGFKTIGIVQDELQIKLKIQQSFLKIAGCNSSLFQGKNTD